MIVKYTDTPFFLLIRNRDVANSFKQFFSVVWRNASKF